MVETVCGRDCVVETVCGRLKGQNWGWKLGLADYEVFDCTSTHPSDLSLSLFLSFFNTKHGAGGCVCVCMCLEHTHTLRVILPTRTWRLNWTYV